MQSKQSRRNRSRAFIAARREAPLLALFLVACGDAEGRQPSPAAQQVLPATCKAVSGTASPLLVDDFEDGDLLLDTNADLRGLWYVNNDGTGEQAPAPGAEADGTFIAAPGSPQSPAFALHTSGAGFEQWGAFAGTRLNASQSQPCTYDLSQYDGLHFYAKGKGRVRVNIGTADTTPIVDGGNCAGSVCSDYGVSVALSSDWSGVEARFDTLTQPSWATPEEFAPASGLRVSFWSESEDFDFWIDDVQFYED
jgi:hypothetical protein